jgi:Rho family, other
MLNICFVGDEEVGKSCIIQSLLGEKFNTVHLKTIANQYELGENTLTDTSGSSVFDRLRPFSYQGVDIVVLCYAVNSITSFTALKEKVACTNPVYS